MEGLRAGQFRFGHFLLDVKERTLFRSGDPPYLPPRTFDTLLFLVSRPGQLVTKEELISAVWDGAVVTDNALTRCIKEVRQALGDDAKNPRYVETVPRVGYRFVAKVEERPDAGEPPSAPTGETYGESRPEPAITAEKSRRPGFVLLLVLAVALAWVLLKPRPGVDDTGPHDVALAENAVAVLPFADFTDNGELEYYGEGIAEEVTNRLSLVDGLSVLAFTVSSRYGGSGADPREVARELGVRYIVSGSIRPAGDALRVSTALLAAESGIQLWSITEETTVLEAYSVQDRITRDVVAAMRSELKLAGDRPPTLGNRAPDPEAYDLYLRGRSIWSRRGVEDIRTSVDMLREAVRVDPLFARGWSALASAYVVWPSYSPEGYSSWHLARDAARKALDLDASLAEPRGVLAAFAHQELDWTGAATLHKEALEIEPRNATINYWFSEHLAKTGQYADSLAWLARARTLDPTYPPTLVDSVFAFAMYGRAEEAFRVFEHAWNSGIRSPVMYQAGIIASILKRDFELARVLVDESPVPDEHKHILQKFVRVEAGELDAGGLLSELASDHESWPHYVFFVWMTARLDAMNLAFEALDERLAAGGSVETRMLWGPGHRLIENEEFDRLASALGLTGYWTNVARSEFCDAEGMTLACRTPAAEEAPDSLDALLDTFRF